MLRSIVSGLVLAALVSLAAPQDLLFTRSEAKTDWLVFIKSSVTPMPAADGGYVLLKESQSGSQGAELSRYNRHGDQLASTSILGPLGNTVTQPSVAVDSQRNIYVAYSSLELGRDRVFIEKYSPTLTRVGRLTADGPTFVINSLQLVSDGTNLYLGYLDGTVLRLMRIGVNFTFSWVTTLEDVNLLTSMAVNQTKLLVGLGAGQTPFLAAYATADGNQIGAENLPNNGEFSTENTVASLAFAPNGDAFGLTQTVAGVTQLFRYSASNVLTNGPVASLSSPVNVMVTPSGICYSVNDVGGFTTRRANATTLNIEASASGAQPVFKSLFDPVLNVIRSVSNTGTVFSQSPDSLSLDQATAIPNLNDFSFIGQGRSVYVARGSDNVGARQLGIQRFNVGKLWDFTEFDRVPAPFSADASVVDSQNNLWVLVQGATTHSLSKYSPAGVLLWSEVLMSDRTLPRLFSSIAIGPDDQPVVFYGFRDFLYLTKFSTSGARVFDVFQSTASFRDPRVAVAPDNSIYTLHARTGQAEIARWDRTNGSNLWRSSRSVEPLDFGLTPSGHSVVAGRNGVGDAVIVVTKPDGTNLNSNTVSTLSTQDAKLAIQPSGLAAVAFLLRKPNGIFEFNVRRFDPIRNQTLMNSTLVGNAVRPTYAVATSAAGTIYLAQAGTTRGLVQYNSSGAIAFVKTLPSGVTEIVKCITDAQNSVYVLAREQFTVPQGGIASGWIFVKYNTLGTLLAQRRFQSPTPGLNGTPASIAIGRVFDLWVTGSMQLPGLPGAATVQRYLQPVAPTVLGETYQISVNQTFSDPAPGVLRNDSDLNGDPLTVQLVSNPAEGSVQLNSNGSFTFTAGPTEGITVNFKYRVTDSTGRSTIGQCNLEQIP